MEKLEIKVPKFESIGISTKTIIAVTNFNINIEKLFDALPITTYIVIPKKRGRKKKDPQPDPNLDIPTGSIVTLKYEDKVRGVELKKKKKATTKGKRKYFRNSLTVVMIMGDGKMINFKISNNGKFQITGCKNDTHAEDCVKYIYKYVKEINNPEICSVRDKEPKAVFMTVMTNIDFNLGFQVNRENLDRYINCYTPYNSLLETSFGYTGVNIKMPMNRAQNYDLKLISYKDDIWTTSYIPYGTYLEGLTQKEKDKETKKSKNHTFLVFHSGNCIFSSDNIVRMKHPYEQFIDIIRECKDEIEEKIIEE